ncbi:MAG: pentapeptide repeat-containing protein [Thermoanaerobaculia bacterium]|nr:pentapeptide repeat-containing protein [Thermoanaerobaculia bacterium]
MVRPNLSNANLSNANLSNANLSKANLIEANLLDARLSGTDLSEAINLTQSQVEVAHGDVATRLPQGLTRPAHWE